MGGRSESHGGQARRIIRPTWHRPSEQASVILRPAGGREVHFPGRLRWTSSRAGTPSVRLCLERTDVTVTIARREIRKWL